MCRGIGDEGNRAHRRCACDNSAARQARRVRARAHGDYGVTGSAAAKPVMAVASSIPAPPTASIERARELRDEIQQLNERYENLYQSRPGERQTSWEVDGVTYTSGSDAALAINAAIERRVVETGAQISELAALRSGVSETQMQEWYETELARLDSVIDSYRQAPLTPEAQARKEDLEARIIYADRERETFEALHRDDYPHDTLSGFPSRILVHIQQHPRDQVALDLYRQHQRLVRTSADLALMRAQVANPRTQAQIDVENEYNHLKSDIAATHPDLAVMMADRADAYRAILAEIRPMGGQLTVSKDSKKDRVATLQDAMENYPTAWIEASNAATDKRPLRIKYTGGRAHYSHGAIQKKSKRVQKLFMVRKPADWQPDPTDPREREMVKVEPDAGGNYSYEILPNHTMEMRKYSVSDTNSVWVQPQYETYYARGAAADDPNWSPGKNYIRHVDRWTAPDGTVREQITFLKPKYEQIQTERELTSELTIDDDGKGFMGRRGYTTAIHEFGHRAEHTGPKLITRMEDTFLQRRRKTLDNGEREKVSAIYEGRKEYGYADEFANKYMGKVYVNSDSREVLTTGMESIFGGSFGGLMGTAGQRRDPDMRNFVLGLLATA